MYVYCSFVSVFYLVIYKKKDLFFFNSMFLLFQPKSRTLGISSSMCSLKMEVPLLNLAVVAQMFYMQLLARASIITDGCGS